MNLLPSLIPILGALRERDLLLLTADHGGDPSDVSTDHTREYVPVVAAGPCVKAGVDVGNRSSSRINVSGRACPLTARLTSSTTGPDSPKCANSSEPRRCASVCP